MRTIEEIECRSFEINCRVAGIFEELREARGDQEVICGLTEELAKLLHEAKVIRNNLRFYQETTRRLMSGDCHGPH